MIGLHQSALHPRERSEQEKECFCERARESSMWMKEDKKGERMEREPREIQRGCESAAGFPGFVVMTTEPPLPDQTEIRATTDGNVYTNAHAGRGGPEGGREERRKDAEGRKKPGEYGRADGERDGMAWKLPPRARFLQSFRNPRRLAIRRLLHRERRPSDSQPSREMYQRIEYFDPLSAEFVAPLSVILHRIVLGKRTHVEITYFQQSAKCRLFDLNRFY
ncbi:hypothetical protein ALC57_09376 [Trachymyrmex cornetzi]|uniref:Uncharacterized protein n=1 Tax=Trachymyrmex cornetzi TaxID=471704 RepID=A0A195E066_9HYME|nr:hypothetical protein ALC57_09376 [Trachymyrmex cornetzi]